MQLNASGPKRLATKNYQLVTLMTLTADPIIEALEEQVACYRKLAKLAELQHVHVQQEQVDALMDVLKHRQTVLDVIADLEQTIAPARQKWSEYTGGLPTDLRARAEGLVAEARRLLEEITTADRNDAMVLQQRKLNIGRQINKTSGAAQMNRRYAAAAYGQRKASMDVRQ